MPTADMQLQPFFCTKPHPVAYCSVPCPLAMAEPALLWTAADMREREDGRYEYIPTQVFDNPVALSSVHWRSPPLARQRLLMISATHHTNTTIGNIYVATLSDRSRTAVARAPHHRAHRALMAGWAGGASTCILDVMIADGPGRDGSTLHGSVGATAPGATVLHYTVPWVRRPRARRFYTTRFRGPSTATTAASADKETHIWD
jgi:hypothetical protein